MPENALSLLPSPPANQSAIRPDLLPHAEKIAGTIGFIVNAVRPDGYFGSCVLASYINSPKMPELVFRLLIRLARYLASTRDLTSPFGPRPPRAQAPRDGLDLFRGFVDSSHGNAPLGRSYGGFVLFCDGGGALAWKMAAPIAGDDSSGAAELRMSTLAYKYILALRTLQISMLALHPRPPPSSSPTPSQAIVDDSERLKKSSRWMAPRYAMIRWGLACKTIRLMKVPAVGNVADIVTKCLTGAAFIRHRAPVLGLTPPSPERHNCPLSPSRFRPHRSALPPSFRSPVLFIEARLACQMRCPTA
jgi:hypothetical protein